MADIITARWEVADKGYQVGTFRPLALMTRQFADEGRYLVFHEEATGRYRYDPLAYSQLYLEFAQTEPTEQGIVAFAKHYGFLGRYVEQVAPTNSDANKMQLQPGEAISAWQAELAKVHSIVELWSAVEDIEIAELERRIQNSDGNYVHIQPASETSPATASPVATPDFRREAYRFIIEEPDPQDRRETAARFHIQKVVNRELAQCTASRLLWNPRARRSELHIVPNSLSGVIWLQLASNLATNMTPRQCEYRRCRRWFLRHGKARYCARSCQQKAYRDRKGEQ